MLIHRDSTFLLVLLAFALTRPDAASCAPQQTYSALLADGTRLGGNALTDWQDSPARMKLDGRPIAEAKNPLVWLRNNQLTPKPISGAAVHLFGGDVLPCDVYAYRAGNEEPGSLSPPHLLVTPEAAVDWPSNVRRRIRRKFDTGAERNSLRVVLPLVERIIWERRGSTRYLPNTALLRDGRQIAYRSLRWNEASVRLLHAEGTLDVSFDQLAELHLPSRDAWDTFLDVAAVLNPREPARFSRFTTVEGVRATSSGWWFRLPVFFLPEYDNRDKLQLPGRWLLAVQPAWCLDLLWLEWDKIRLRQEFDLNEFPLSVIDPQHVAAPRGLSAGWQWQRDANVQGGPLIAAGKSFGWGLGVHAPSELEFALPGAARAFRTSLGLDVVSGGSGCARGTIVFGAGLASNDRLGAHAAELFSSPVMLGGDAPLDTQWLPLSSEATAGRTLTLRVDPVAHGQPPGAAPLDIGDTFDWLEPRLKLDVQAFQQQIDERVKAHGDGTTWRPATSIAQTRTERRIDEVGGGFVPFAYDAIRLSNAGLEFDNNDRQNLGLAPFTGGYPAVLRKVIRVPEGGAQLRLEAIHHRMGKGRLVIVAGGLRMHDAEVGVGRNRDKWQAVAVDLAYFAGQEIPVEIYSFGQHSYHGGVFLSNLELRDR